MMKFVEVSKDYAKEHMCDGNLYVAYACGRTCVLTPFDNVSVSEAYRVVHDPETAIMVLEEEE